MAGYIRYIFLFLMLLMLQLVVFDHIHLGLPFNSTVFNIAHPVVYFYILLIFPKIPKWMFLLAAFGLGWLMDGFYHTPGINAAACVLVAYFKGPLLRGLKSTDDNEEFILPHFPYLGAGRFFSFIAIGSLMFHTVISFYTVFSFNEIFLTLLRVLMNAALSIGLIYLMDIIFFYRSIKARL
jgi:hypothetical protein